MPLTNTIGTAAARSYGFLTKSGIGGLVIFYSSSDGSLTSGGFSGINLDSSVNTFFNGTNSYGYWDLFSSQSDGTIRFQKKITGSYSASGSGAYIDSSNNLFATGSDSGQTVGGWGPANIYKFDTNGNLSWRVGFFGSSNFITFNACTVDSSGNVYGVGFADTPYRYHLVIKYNSSGVYQWNQVRGNAISGLNAGINACITDSSGNIYLAGFNGINVAGQPSKPIFIKYDTNGSLLSHSFLYDTVAQTYQFTSVATDGTYFYVSGYTYTGSVYECLFCKYNTSTTLQFQKRIYTTTSVFINRCIYSGGYVYLVGYVNVSSKNNILIVKLDTSGTIIWQKMISTSVALNGRNLFIDSSNFVIHAQISTASTQIVQIVLPISNGITGTFTAGGYTFTCSDASVSIGTSTLTSGTNSFNSSNLTNSQQSTFGTISTTTSLTKTSTPI